MKTMSPLNRTTCIAALAVCAVTPVSANDPGFFLGLDIGQSKLDVEEVAATGVFPSTTGARTDDSDTAFSLAFGYRVNSYLSVEFSMRDFGKATLTEQGFGTFTSTATPLPPQPTRPTAGVLDIEQDSEGLALAAVGSLPLQNFEFFGKLGVLYAKTTVTERLFSISTNASSAPVSVLNTVCASANAACTWAFPGAGTTVTSSKGVEMLYAIGAGYSFGEKFYLKLEWMRVPSLGDEDKLGVEEFDVDVLSAGFQYRF